MMKLFTARRGAGEPAALPDHETKAAPLVAVELSRLARFTSPDYAALCREGYARNPIVYRCVRLISEAAASVPFKGEGLPTGGAPMTDTLERFYGYLQVAGTAYLEAVTLDDEPVAIRPLPPDRVKALADKAGRAAGFEIETESGKRRIPRDAVTGRCAVTAMRLFNPACERDGQSPLRAAATSVDLHNQGTRWAKALLDNSARPSGALVYTGGNRGALTKEQSERLKTELEQGFSGPTRAGRPMVLEGGLEWTSMGLSPTDMDFTQGRREAARDIALAFGVPPMLLGIPGDNTYANYAEANRAFWRQTIIPLVAKTARNIEHWLEPWVEGVSLAPDLDRVPALSEERAALWSRLEAASFIDEDERRALAGLAPRVKVQ